ncbi:sigma-70 family RNA polymerase sigma factor [Methylocystis sp.]|uniref:sigma-70 family RNA polymerase sigma factor n=1 Tax=Methylocystis sp. TaxID=1911079 RepID=UPI0025F868D3|nr:sigma-70 family RNA polymerase sigma factor [Methylocystis sp.]
MTIVCDAHAMRLDGPAGLGYAIDDARPSCRKMTVDVHDTLEALLQRVAKRDRAAFRDLYAATSSRLFAVCLRLLRDRARAEEVLQEAFMRIWERAASYDAEKGVALAWMTVLTRRIALNELRRRDSAHASLDEEETPQMAADLPEHDPLAKGRLIECLDRLGEERRQWVLLAYIHGYSHEELARRFQRPLGTMKSALFRGLADLRKCIS